MSPSRFETMLKDPLFRNLKAIVVSGGEPTLRNDLDELLAGIHSSLPNAGIVINSNGILADRLVETVKTALESGMSVHTGISLDGIAERHDSVRGVEGVYAKVNRALRELAALRNLYGERLDISVGFVLSDATAMHLCAVKRYAQDRGIGFNLQWYSEASYYANTGSALLTRNPVVEEVLDRLPPAILVERGKRALNGKSIRFSCFSMYTFCVIKCNGDMVPCFNLWDTKIGNVLEESPSRIWMAERAQNARKLVRNCEGCLCTCAQNWSFQASFFPRVLFNLRHPGELFRKLRVLR